MEFWPEFILIASVHLVAVASPGPDFAIVLRYAVRYGRNVALAASIGIGMAIFLHVCYSLLGLGLLIKTTPWLFTLFSVLSAALSGLYRLAGYSQWCTWRYCVRSSHRAGDRDSIMAQSLYLRFCH